MAIAGMDLSAFVDLVAAFLVGGGAGFLLRRYSPRRIVDRHFPAAVSGHEHDWHISGKLNGRVQLYCTACDATRQRDNAEGG